MIQAHSAVMSICGSLSKNQPAMLNLGTRQKWLI